MNTDPITEQRANISEIISSISYVTRSDNIEIRIYVMQSALSRRKSENKIFEDMAENVGKQFHKKLFYAKNLSKISPSLP